MTLDTSAILAVLQDGAEKAEFVSLIVAAPRHPLFKATGFAATDVVRVRQ